MYGEEEEEMGKKEKRVSVTFYRRLISVKRSCAKSQNDRRCVSGGDLSKRLEL